MEKKNVHEVLESITFTFIGIEIRISTAKGKTFCPKEHKDWLID